jgi:exosortase
MRSQVLTAHSTEASRGGVILAVCLVTLVLFGPGLKTIVSLGLHDDRYLQIVVAPLACFVLIFWERTEIFSRAAYSPHAGIWVLSVSALLGVFAVSAKPGVESGTGLAIAAMILVWMSAFLFCCGFESFRAALYPLCCLFLMIPLPSSWMDRAAVFLQHGSAAMSYRILRMTAMPVLRHGMTFSLPGLDFEVAPECSGLHSSLALMMVAIVASYVFLRSAWSRAALIAMTVPIAIIKNAIRIVVITVLGARVDRWFIDGPFHHRYGGIIFSAVAVAIFVLLLAGLQKIERWRASWSLD